MTGSWVVLAAGDTVFLTAATVVGLLLAGRVAAERSLAVAFGFITGVAAFTVAGVAALAASVTTGVPFGPAVVAVVVSVGAGLTGWRRHRAGVGALLRHGLAAAPAFGLLAAATRGVGVRPSSFSDGVAFLLSAAGLAAGRVDVVSAEPLTFYSFPPGPKVLHTFGFLYDRRDPELLLAADGGVRTLGVALLAAVLLLVFHTVRHLTDHHGRTASRLLAAGAAACLATAHYVVFTAHVNGSHGLVAAATLAVPVGVLLVRRDPTAARGVTVGLTLAVAALALHRVETILTLPIFLLAAYRLPDVDRTMLRRLWQTLAATTAGWMAVALIPYVRTPTAGSDWGRDPRQAILTIIGLGLVVYVAATAEKYLPERWLPELPKAAVAVVFLGLAGYGFVAPAELRTSVSATVTNLLPVDGPARGEWKLAGVVLVAALTMILVSRVWSARPELSLFTYPALLFLPVSLLAGFARGFAYRVGWADSFNRSWLHIVAFVAIAAITIDPPTRRAAEAAGGDGDSVDRDGVRLRSGSAG